MTLIHFRLDDTVIDELTPNDFAVHAQFARDLFDGLVFNHPASVLPA